MNKVEQSWHLSARITDCVDSRQLFHMIVP